MSQTSSSIDSARFDVRDIPCRIKHGQIFQRWTDLAVGDHFILINDHDPIPLYHQFAAQFPDAFDWEYLLRGPDEFQVKITRLAPSPLGATAPQQCPGHAEPPANVLDVRPIPGRLKHTRIFECWRALAAGDHFVLLNDHDPVPLRYQFEAEFAGAFAWEYLEDGPEEFRVKITKLAESSAARPATTPSSTSAKPAVASRTVAEIDARGLEPPEPLIRILDALESLPPGWCLRAITDREPCHLFGEAEQRGFRHESTAQSDGSWTTFLDRA